MNKKLLKGKIMNIKRIIVLVLISASSGLLCAQRKTVNMSDRYGILTVTPLDKYTGAASLLKTNGVRFPYVRQVPWQADKLFASYSAY